jgi:hypothetical protein
MTARPARTEAQATPGAIRLVLGLLVLSAAAYFLAAVFSVVLVWHPEESQILFGSPVSDWYWSLSALLFAVLGVVYLVVARSVRAADSGAGLAVSLLGLLGAGFSLLAITHSYGWGVLLLSLVLLAANQSRGAQSWYAG